MRTLSARLATLFQRSPGRERYLPEVDGLRFIAIGLVFLLHMLFVYGGVQEGPVLFPLKLGAFFGGGYKGVYLFFTISGFVVALPFARSAVQGSPRPGLRNYYLRRLIRIEPPHVVFMTFLLLVRILAGQESIGYLLRHWAASVFYLHNILYDRASVLTVIAWSLEVEVQFYVLAPLLFRVFRLSVRRQAVVFSVVFLISGLASAWLPEKPVTLLSFFPYFWVGIAIAGFYVRAKRYYSGFWLLLVFGAALFLFTALVPQGSVFVRLALPLLSGLLLFLGLFATPVRRVLSLRSIALVGGMCYSIYLTHFYVIGQLGEHPLPEILHLSYPPIDYLWHCVLYAVPVLLVASFFYLFIEKPFMNLSRRWTKRPVAGEGNAPATRRAINEPAQEDL